MASFFDSSRVDEEQPGDSSRPRDGGEDFFSFNDAPLFKNKEEPVGGLFFGDGSSKEENQQGFSGLHQGRPTPHLISPFPSLREDSVTLSPNFLLHFPELLQARGKIKVLPLL